MNRISIVMGLQESHQPVHDRVNHTGEEVRTLIWFLSQGMDSLDHRGSSSSSRWRSIKERLGLKGIACCGCGGGLSTWGTRHSTMSVIDDDDDEQEDDYIYQNTPQRRESESMDHPVQEHDPVCMDPVSVAGSGMNLATALAAERQYRAAQQDAQLVGPTRVPGTPLRMSLMRLLEESEGMNGGEDVTTAAARGDGGSSNETVCCVCMIRKKGAAFIPCGHTFCRVCSRELWLNRGFCPLCNRSILEILDIF